MTQSEIWQVLTTSALLGTERHPFELPQAGDGALGALLTNLPEKYAANPEHSLLSAAAALTLYRHAGTLPSQDNSSLPHCCAPETLAPCLALSASHLHTMLAGEYGAALSEWLEEAARRGKVVPPDQLPVLLGLGQTQPSFRPYILPVIGNRGHWLANIYKVHNQWAYVRDASTIATPDDESTRALWETGSIESRMAVLQSLRSTRPDHARTLVESVWKQESASARNQFIYALRTGLSMSDEPFLESALDDKSKDVRSNAADLLADLPESRYMQRMIEATTPLISLKRLRQGKLFGLSASNKDYIKVALSQDYTPNMKRDGIEQKPNNPRMGERAYWLHQQLCRIPPRIWTERWGVEPREIIMSALQTKDWKDVLVEAWIAATVRHNDAAWAEAFLAHGLSSLSQYAPERLVRLLDPRRRDELVTSTLTRQPQALYTDDMPIAVLWTLRKPWPTEVCRAILRSVSHHIKHTPRHGNWQVSQSLSTFAYSMAPTLLQEAESILTTTDATPNNLKAAADEFLSTLQFRRDMLQALAE
ncbi:MAG: DUF5691 domain-containing protein [Chloroflexia bacterium]